VKIRTTEDVHRLLNIHGPAAALGAAIERGLFWLLAERALPVTVIADSLSIPVGRCRYWLALLEQEGLLEQGPDGFAVTAAARSAISTAHSQETWALLAAEARERMAAFVDLPDRLEQREAGGGGRHDYVAKMMASPERAARFTRMLAELHRNLAEAVAERLDLGGVDRLMDLGGGSGVVAQALLRRNPRLEVVVVDIENVCAAGRALVVDSPVADRIHFHPADISREDLPSGFDAVLECDVGVYDDPLLARIRDSLNPGGRLLVVDIMAPAPGIAPPARVEWAFTASLSDPDFRYETAEGLSIRLAQAGLDVTLAESFRNDWTFLEAHRPRRPGLRSTPTTLRE